MQKQNQKKVVTQENQAVTQENSKLAHRQKDRQMDNGNSIGLSVLRGPITFTWFLGKFVLVITCLVG